MRELTLKVDATDHPELLTEGKVEELMAGLTDQHPDIHGWTYEIEDNFIYFILWGEIDE